MAHAPERGDRPRPAGTTQERPTETTEKPTGTTQEQPPGTAQEQPTGTAGGEKPADVVPAGATLVQGDAHGDEDYGEVGLTRYRKADGRALILFRWRSIQR